MSEGEDIVDYTDLLEVLLGKDCKICYSVMNKPTDKAEGLKHSGKVLIRNSFNAGHPLDPTYGSMSTALENPTNVDVIKFADTCMKETMDKAHCFYEGIIFTGTFHCRMPVYELLMGS